MQGRIDSAVRRPGAGREMLRVLVKPDHVAHRTGLLVSNPKLKVLNAESGKTAAAGYSNSDRLGIALFLVGIAFAIVLFLAEKTPTTVLVLLASVVGALVYPVLHFCRTPRRRIVIFVILAIVVFAFGRGVWPKKPPSSRAADSDKLNEIVNLIKNQDAQQKFLSQYPLGYTIFQLDSVRRAKDWRRTNLTLRRQR